MKQTIKSILPGFGILIFLFVATIVAGVIVAMNSASDNTLKAMLYIFVYPTPYVVLGLLAVAFNHSSRSRVIAHTFNTGSGLLLISWINSLFLSTPVADEMSTPLENATWDHFVTASIIAGIFAVILIVEAQLIWQPAQRK